MEERETPSTSVAERLIDEGLLSISQARKLCPPVKGTNKYVSKSAIFRWIVEGKHGIRLEAIKMNGESFWTSKPALARFASALTARTG